MSFSPGQFITAQRLNRLQPKSYFGQSSSNISTVGGGNVAGTAVNITVETNGATAAFTWTCCTYATGAMTANNTTTAKWDVNLSPTIAVAQGATTNDKITSANVWVTTITTAGTYTFQLAYANQTNGNIQIYTSMMVQILEVA
jgi:hypothetical protein